MTAAPRSSPAAAAAPPGEASPGEARRPWPRFVGPLALLLAVGYQLFSAAQPLDFLLSNVFQMDDAYYYLQVARNVAERGLVSFDGVHATSGIQPLWTVLLSGLALVVTGKVAFLRAVMVFSALLNAVSGVLLGRLGRRLHSDGAGQAAQVLWAGFLLALAPTVIAMEYPLYVLTLLAVLLGVTRIWRAPEEADTRRLLLLGLGLAVLYWVRLDSAFFSVLVAGAVAARLAAAGAANRARLAALLVPGLLGAALYVGVCEWVADAPMPISGLVKKHYSALHFEGRPWWLALAGHALWFVQVNARPLLDTVSSGLTESRPWTAPLNLLIAAGVLAATAVGARHVLRRGDTTTRRAALFLAALLAAGVAHSLLVITSIGHFASVTQHYYGWSLVTWMLWGGLLVALLARRWPAAPYILLASFLLLGVPVVRYHLDYAGHDRSLHRRREAAMDWMARELPADARIGAWNAGQFGYFLDRTVINLDGLANDRAYLEFLRSGRPVLEYLRAEHIDYVVDTHALDLTMPYGTDLAPDDPFRGVLPREAFDVVWRESDSPRAIMVLRLR